MLARRFYKKLASKLAPTRGMWMAHNKKAASPGEKRLFQMTRRA